MRCSIFGVGLTVGVGFAVGVTVTVTGWVGVSAFVGVVREVAQAVRDAATSSTVATAVRREDLSVNIDVFLSEGVVIRVVIVRFRPLNRYIVAQNNPSM